MSERVATVWRILRSVMCVGGLTITPNNPLAGRKQKEEMEWKMILN
jgi:hypothetical protein